MIYINIGSNLKSLRGDRLYNLKKSVELIASKKIRILKTSNIYETPSYPNEKDTKFTEEEISKTKNEEPKVDDKTGWWS